MWSAGRAPGRRAYGRRDGALDWPVDPGTVAATTHGIADSAAGPGCVPEWHLVGSLRHRSRAGLARSAHPRLWLILYALSGLRDGSPGAVWLARRCSRVGMDDDPFGLPDHGGRTVGGADARTEDSHGDILSGIPP